MNPNMIRSCSVLIGLFSFALIKGIASDPKNTNVKVLRFIPCPGTFDYKIGIVQKATKNNEVIYDVAINVPYEFPNDTRAFIVTKEGSNEGWKGQKNEAVTLMYEPCELPYLFAPFSDQIVNKTKPNVKPQCPLPKGSYVAKQLQLDFNKLDFVWDIGRSLYTLTMASDKYPNILCYQTEIEVKKVA